MSTSLLLPWYIALSWNPSRSSLYLFLRCPFKSLSGLSCYLIVLYGAQSGLLSTYLWTMWWDDDSLVSDSIDPVSLEILNHSTCYGVGVMSDWSFQSEANLRDYVGPTVFLSRRHKFWLSLLSHLKFPLCRPRRFYQDISAGLARSATCYLL